MKNKKVIMESADYYRIKQGLSTKMIELLKLFKEWREDLFGRENDISQYNSKDGKGYEVYILYITSFYIQPKHPRKFTLTKDKIEDKSWKDDKIFFASPYQLEMFLDLLTPQLFDYLKEAEVFRKSIEESGKIVIDVSDLEDYCNTI